MAEVYEREKLKDQLTCLESEARMIIPGIKALFGFQLVAVFNERFAHDLSQTEQTFHWAALLCSALAIALAISPAAYHRVAEPHTISTRMARLTSRWLTYTLAPLTLGYVIDFYLIGVLVLKNPVLNMICTLLLLSAFIGLWFVYPNIVKNRPEIKRANAPHGLPAPAAISGAPKN